MEDKTLTSEKLVQATGGRWRFSLASLLLVIALVAVLCGVYFQERSARKIMSDIAAHYESLDYGNVRFESDISELKPTLDLLPGPIPKELEGYLSTCIPKSRFDTGLIAFYSLSELVDEQKNCIPASAVHQHGFFCFAQEGDGSAFAYRIDDHRVYHLGFINDGDYFGTDVAEQIADGAWESWPNLRSFLLYAESQLRQNLKGN